MLTVSALTHDQFCCDAQRGVPLMCGRVKGARGFVTDAARGTPPEGVRRGSTARQAGSSRGLKVKRCRTITQLMPCGTVPQPKRPPPRTQRGQSQGKCTE